jgi:phosphoribosylformimino-5-aminoimidazole carboxamide ribotide isomerase
MPIMPFQVVAVLDLKNAVAVHAVAGRRAHYQPIQSILHPSADPFELAHAVRDTLGLHVLYVADLDAIAGQPPNLKIYRQIMSLGIHLLIDAGLRDVRSAAPLVELDRAGCTVVAGLETLRSSDALLEIVNELGPRRVIFSLDLFEGRPVIAPGAQWSSDDPAVLLRQAIERGVEQVLLLDVARVGTGRGVGVLSLLAETRTAHPDIRVTAGGGISGLDDVLELKNAGAAGVLIASAFHDGRIGRRELGQLDHGDRDLSPR